MLQMVEGFGRKAEGELFVDSTAALGTVNRKGNGKLRHIRVGQLWIQQTAEDEDLQFRKIGGKSNPADACTKHLTQNNLDKAMETANMEYRTGRAEEGLEVRAVDEHKVWRAWTRVDLNPRRATTRQFQDCNQKSWTSSKQSKTRFVWRRWRSFA